MQLFEMGFPTYSFLSSIEYKHKQYVKDGNQIVRKNTAPGTLMFMWKSVNRKQIEMQIEITKQQQKYSTNHFFYFVCVQ